jgi:hypothetical protein
VRPVDEGLIERGGGRTPPRTVRVEHGGAPEQDAALVAYLARVVRLRHLCRQPSPAASRAAGW